MKIRSRFIKVSGLLLVTVATVVTATAFFLPYLLDVNAYRAEIVMALQQSLNRKVSFGSGSFVWHLGPSFEFKSFTVKERDGGADFITARQITVKLALIPLLEKKVELKNLILDGTTISLLRNSDGTYNIDDLLKPGGDAVHVNFKKIRIIDGVISWRDMAGRKVPLDASLRNISLTTNNLGRGQKGHIKLSADLPAASGPPAHITLSAALRLPSGSESLMETVIDGDLSVKQGEIGRFWPYFGRYVPFANTGGRVDFVTSFKGKPQDFSAKGNILISGATVKWPTVFHATLSPKTLQLQYKVTMTKQLIDFSTVDISMEEMFRIKGSFQMQDYMTKDPRIIAKASTPSTFRYEEVRNFVPYGIIDTDTADYIENKIKTGIFKLDTGILDGRVSQIAHMERGQNYNTLMIRGPVEKATLSYGPKAPTFNKLKGIIELKGKNFNLIGMTGNFGTSPFSLDGSITEYNTDKTADYPIRMDITPHPPEMEWLAKTAGIPKLEYSNNSSLQLVGGGHYSAYRLNGDWDLKQAAYSLPGYVNKPLSMPHTLKFSAVIGRDSTKVTSLNYNLQPLVITGSGLIGYGEKPYLGFDLQTNRFVLSETLPILSMWQEYKLRGTVQAHIKGGGDPDDFSAMDYHGSVDIKSFSLHPGVDLKQISDINGSIIFKGNSLETSNMAAHYGSSAMTMKAAIKSLKSPKDEIMITLSSPQLYLRDINLADGHPDAAIRRLNANCTLRKGSVTLRSVSGLINSSNFNLNGKYLTGRTPQATISVTSSKLDLDDLRIFASPAQKGESPQTPGLDLKLALNVDAGNFGKLTFSKLKAAVQQEKGTIYLQHLTAGMLGGKLTAKGKIAPGGVKGDYYDLNLDISKADADKLFDALEISREVSGTLALHGNLTARGNTLLDIKKSALGNIHLNMNNGMLRKFNTLSKVFSILNVSQLLKFQLPDMVSGGMPYNSIKGDISVKGGLLDTQDLFISSNAINISIVGSADIVKEELNLTLGVQPLQTVDKIVNRIPIVGWLLTGKEKDLLTAYFEAKGKWSDPQVSAIPVKSIGKGILHIFIRAFQLPVKLFTDTGEVVFGQ
jgi:uncharacterized protein involved in outer membrane biogenesis